MCLAVPGKVICINGVFATIDMMGFQQEVYISLIEDIKVGEYVLVHAGCAIEKIDHAAYKQFMQFHQELMGADL